MDNLLIFFVKILFDNGIIPIKFGGSISLAIFGIIALVNGKGEEPWKTVGIGLLIAAAIGAFAVALNLA